MRVVSAGWRRVWVRKSLRFGASGLAVVAPITFADVARSPAAADPTQPQSGRQVWAGADVSTNVWLVYSGVTFAPWSAMHDDGFRFRAAGGYGEYEYEKSSDPSVDSDDIRHLDFQARTYFADFLVGYLKRFGELTAKAYVGASVISHDITPDDEYTIAVGDEVGIKGVIELWLNIGESAWGSLDLSWSSAHDTRAARARLGYRVWPKLSIGIEGGINVDSQGQCRMQPAGTAGCGYADERQRGKFFEVEEADLLDYARAGTFLRYEWGASEASISTGILGDSFASDDKVELAPYVTVNWLTQF